MTIRVFDHTSKIESERGFYNWALKQVQNKGDLNLVKDWINHHGTQEQKELVAKWESHFAHPTWQSYANLHGTKYTAPISDVAEADRRAAAIIEANKAAEEAKNVVSVIEESAPIIEEGSKVTEEVSQVTNNASKFGKYAKWAIGAAAVGFVGAGLLYLFNKCTSGNNKAEAEPSKPQKTAQSKPEVVSAQPTQENPSAPVDSVVIPKPEIKPIDIPEIPEDIGNTGDDAVTGEKPTSYKAAPYGAGIWNLVKDHYLEDYKEEVDAIKAYYKEQTGKDAKEDTIIQALSRAICDKMDINYFAKPQTKLQYMQDVRVDDIDMELVKKYLFE